MSLPQTQLRRYTVEEYLTLERASEERHEYLDGEIYAMAGESLAHGDICMNLSRELSTQLRGKPCRALSRDTKVRSGPLPVRRRSVKGLFSYPDVVVVCGQPQFLDEYQDVLINPTVIIEVLSPTTEAFDRGEKFRRYQAFNPSLSDYVLVSQHVPFIEHLARKPNGQWIMTLVGELSGSLHLASIDCTVRLADVYDRVSFPETEDEQAVES
jgi:Uma2 family endonuclease